MTHLKEQIKASDLRRGACPTLAKPMMTGDGLLSRVALEAEVSPDALVAICTAALRHGNGLIDISARGNLQARGLTEESARAFEAEMRALALPLRAGIVVDTDPLAGLDPDEIEDPRPLALAIRSEADAAGLADKVAAKTAIVVDGGGAFSLGDLLADIRLTAIARDTWLLQTGGTAQSGAIHGTVTSQNAPRAALRLLLLLSQKGRLFRARDFQPSEVREQLQDLLQPPPETLPERETRPPLGLFALSDGRYALGIAPPFAQIEATRLAAFIRRAASLGIEAVRTAPGHALLLIGPEETCRPLKGALSGDFLTEAGDPRAAIAVCPGAPFCTSATFDTRALAADAAGLVRLLDGSFTLHLSGCPKGCAHPRNALLAVSGRADGLALTFDGRADGDAAATFTLADASAALHRLAAEVELRRGQEETAAQCLTRLGPAPVAAALMKGHA